MRIAIASASFPSREDENPVFPANWEVARALHDLGHEVFVMTFCEEDNPEDREREVCVGGIRVLRIQRDKSRYAAFSGSPIFTIFSWQAGRARELFVKCSDVLNDFKPDVLESQDFNGLGFFWAAEHQYPLVVRCHGPASMFMRDEAVGKFSLVDIEFTEAMEMATINAADGVIAVSQDLADRASRASGRTKDGFQVIRVPLRLREPLPEERIYRCDDGFPLLFNWGQVSRQKGVDLLIEALPEVAAKFPGVRLWIGGKEAVEHGQSQPYGNYLRSRLDELGLRDHVTFLGPLGRKEIRQRVTEADICLFPSRYETACYAALEALSDSGCVLAARVGGMGEYHEHGKSSWYFEGDNAHALAESIIKLSSDDNLRSTLSRSARDHVKSFCDPEKIASESIGAYQRAIERYASRNARYELPFRTLAEHIGKALEDENAAGSYARVCHDYLSNAWQEGYNAGEAAGLQSRQPGIRQSLLSLASRIKRKLLAGSTR